MPAETLLCKYLPDQEKGWAPLIYTFNLLKNFVSTSTIRRLKVKNNAFETFDILIKVVLTNLTFDLWKNENKFDLF